MGLKASFWKDQRMLLRLWEPQGAPGRSQSTAGHREACRADAHMLWIPTPARLRGQAGGPSSRRCCGTGQEGWAVPRMPLLTRYVGPGEDFSLPLLVPTHHSHLLRWEPLLAQCLSRSRVLPWKLTEEQGKKVWKNGFPSGYCSPSPAVT